jgi:hypothetical protein
MSKWSCWHSLVFLGFLLLFRIIRECKLVVSLAIAFGYTVYSRSRSRTLGHLIFRVLGCEGVGYVSAKDFDVKIDLGL